MYVRNPGFEFFINCDFDWTLTFELPHYKAYVIISWSN